jgi:hypothetical protein
LVKSGSPAGIAVVAFAWTGENNDPASVSWIAHYTNKIGAGDIARVTITSSSETLFTTATADIDGNWQTSAVQLSAGTYTVTVAEYLPADTYFTTPLSPTSYTLTLMVVPVIYHCTPGNDQIIITGNNLTGYADDGNNDPIYFQGSQNQLFGGTGNDWLGVSGDNNALVGGSGNNWIGATGNGNTLAGGFALLAAVPLMWCCRCRLRRRC